MGFLRWLERMRQSSGLERFRNEIADAQFVSGPSHLVEVVVAQNDCVAVLPENLIPDFDLIGRIQTGATSGSITVVDTNGRSSRTLPDAPEFHLFIYPRTKVQDQLWSGNFSPESLMNRVLAAAMDHPPVCRAVAEFALRWVWNRGGHLFDSMPLFQFIRNDGTSMYLSLNEVRRAKHVRLVASAPKEDRTPGELWLKHSPHTVWILRKNKIRFSTKGPTPPAQYAKIHFQMGLYYEPAWGCATRDGNLVTIPVYDESDLVVDLQTGNVRTPVPDSDGQALMKSTETKSVDVEHTHIRGDTKTHDIHLMTVLWKTYQLKYRVRFKDYYEGGSPQRELDEYQGKARLVFFRFRDLLKHRDIDGFKSLFEEK